MALASIAVAFTFTLGAAVIGARRLVLAPLATLVDVTTAIGAGRLDVAVPGSLRRGSSEFADLARAMDAMTAALRRDKERIEESTAQYRRIVDNAGEGIWTVDSGGLTTFANGRLADMLGYTVDEVRGRPFTDFMDDEARRVAATAFERRQAGIREEMEFRFQHKDGHDVWTHLTTAPFMDNGGRFAGALAMAIDITERKRAERALASSEARLRKILDSMFAFVGLYTTEGIVLEINQVALDAGSLRKEDVIGRPFAELPYFSALPDSQAQVREIVRRAAQGEVGRGDVIARLAGQNRVFDAIFGPLRDDEGRTAQVVGSGVDVTDRRQAEAALSAAERRLSVVLENVTDGFFTLDREWRYGNVNPAAARLVGRSPEELIGRVYLDVFPEAAGTIWDTTYRQVMATRAPASAQDYYEPLDRWFEADVYPAVDGISVFFRDVSVRKRAERELRENHRRLQHILDSMFTFVGLFSVDGTVLDVNRAPLDATGQRRAELIGKPWWESSSFAGRPDAQAQLRDAVRRAAQGDTVRFDVVAVLGDGAPHTFDTTVGPLYDNGGRVTQLVASGADVTERVRAIEALQIGERRLKEAQRIGRLGSLDWNLRSNELLLSDEALEMFGLDGAATPPTLADVLALQHPDDQARVEESLTRAIAGTAKHDLEHRMIRSDGSVVVVRATAELLRDSNGQPDRLLGTVIDITAAKRAEDEIRRLNAHLEQRVIQRTQQLEAANHELEAFGYSVSHDLRAPLRGVDGFTQAIEEEYADRLDDRGREHLARVRAGVRRMNALIDDMLRLSRVTSGPMRSEPVDLSEMARQAVSELRAADPSRRVAVAIEPAHLVTGDRQLLRAVMTNLLGNAWKFSCGQEEARIAFGRAGADPEPAFYVRDNGAGFDMAYADKLFGAFQRLHTSAEFPGTGIGLAIVQRIVSRHGGRTWAEGVKGQGATFYFAL